TGRERARSRSRTGAGSTSDPFQVAAGVAGQSVPFEVAAHPELGVVLEEVVDRGEDAAREVLVGPQVGHVDDAVLDDEEPVPGNEAGEALEGRPGRVVGVQRV